MLCLAGDPQVVRAALLARDLYGTLVTNQGSNFARDTYLRYISLILEGDETYDTFGTPLGRGWLVYNWQQEQPGARGSFIDKRPRRPVLARA